MSNTGTYVWDHELNKLVKVSDTPSRIVGAAYSTICSFKEPYTEHNLGDYPIEVRSRAHKARLLKERNLVEKEKRHGG